MTSRSLFLSSSYDADAHGFFGELGGQYVPEMLKPALDELTRHYDKIRTEPEFEKALRRLFETYSGRPTPLVFAENLTRHCGGAKIYLKNEGLNHTGAHKINHCLGQALLAKRMNKTRLVAETGAGQHGLATATVAAKFGFSCCVYMGEVDYDRQRPNVFWMEQLGATVVPVKHGTRRLKDAVTAAIQDWIATVDDTYYLLGSALGPHPYPSMVRDFQTIVGLEVQDQLGTVYGESSNPDYVVACVGGGSNAIGIFNPFLDVSSVQLIGVEPGGRGVSQVGDHATKLQDTPQVGIAEGYKSYFIQDEAGQIQETHSIAAGLDYSGIGPQHGNLYKKGRVRYGYVTDDDVKMAGALLAKHEGIIGALESLHAVAYAIQLASKLKSTETVVVNLSGRGDKDLFIMTRLYEDPNWTSFLESQLE